MKSSFIDHELDILSGHTDTCGRGTAYLNVVRAKLDSLLKTYYWIVRRGMQSAYHFTVTNLLDLFNKVTPHCIVDFFREIGFYRRI